MKVDEVRAFLEARMHKTFVLGHPEFEATLAVLTSHPTWGARMSDVVGMRVRRARINGAAQLQLMTNRRWFTVGWRACAPRIRPVREGVKDISEKRLHDAMRTAIRGQIKRFRIGSSDVCVHCGTLSGPFHVDHVHPAFCDIRAMFLAQEEEGAPTEFEIRGSSCRQHFRKQDAAYERRWKTFHQRHAVLQILCKPCNLAKSNK